MRKNGRRDKALRRPADTARRGPPAFSPQPDATPTTSASKDNSGEGLLDYKPFIANPNCSPQNVTDLYFTSPAKRLSPGSNTSPTCTLKTFTGIHARPNVNVATDDLSSLKNLKEPPPSHAGLLSSPEPIPSETPRFG